MHGFAAQILTDARAQHGSAIAAARVGCSARAFELYFLWALGRRRLTQPNRPSIAQLPGPLAKLVAAVHRGQRLGAHHQRIARKGFQVLIVKQLGGPAQFGAQVFVAGGPAWCGHRRGLQGRKKTGAQLGQAVCPVQHRQGLRGTGRGFQRGRRHVGDCHALDKHPRFGGF